MTARNRLWKLAAGLVAIATAGAITGCDGATAGNPTAGNPTAGNPTAGDPTAHKRSAPMTMTRSTLPPVDGVDDSTVHDPSVVKAADGYYLFSTGVLDRDNPGGIAVHRSTGSLAGPWEPVGAVPLPAWTRRYAVNHLWAPHVAERNSTFYLYYAASSFGTNHSAIGVASSKTPGDLSSWVDHGPILTSDTPDDFNAIDPMVIQVGDQWWITFGSFWSGIKLRRLLDMTHVDDRETYSLAARPAVQNGPIEAPAIVKHDAYFYLFVSWDYCCKGLDSSYRTVVGRSRSITGPYLDKEGIDMADGGGTTVLQSEGNQVGPGGGDVFHSGGTTYFVHHYYDAEAAGTPALQIRTVNWNDGWPQL